MKSKESDNEIQQSWDCSVCTFKNYPKIVTCEMCGQQKPAQIKQIEMKPQNKIGFQCHACSYRFDSLLHKCPKCHQILIPQQEQDQNIQTFKQQKSKQKKTQTKLLKCRSCNQNNDPQNEICVFCEQNLKEQIESSLIPIRKRRTKIPKPPRYRGYRAAQQCRYCKMSIYISTTSLQQHEQSCGHMAQEDRNMKFIQIEKRYCTFCYQKFEPQSYQKHQRQCKQRKQFYSQSSQTYKRCTKLQKQTMLYMHSRSQKLHWIAEKNLTKRIVKLGYKSSELQNLHHYIVNYAPIIIHMHVSKHMQFFVKDTHYRNQFQTKKSSGSLSQTSRINWEDRMFDRKHHNATPFERVKYGTINFTNDPKGVRACVGYGQSYFLLKPHVRNRCTVTDMDSSSPSATIATFQFCYHLLNKLPDAQLKAAFEGSKANQVASNVIGSYKQIQIHGPVQFKYDIQRVYVNKAELFDPANQKMVKQFCKNNDLEYEVFQEEKIAGVIGGFGTGIFGSPAMFAPLAPAPIPSFHFSAPVPSSSTSHLFGGGSRVPARGLIPPSIPLPQKQPQEGVDYI